MVSYSASFGRTETLAQLMQQVVFKLATPIGVNDVWHAKERHPMNTQRVCHTPT